MLHFFFFLMKASLNWIKNNFVSWNNNLFSWCIDLFKVLLRCVPKQMEIMAIGKWLLKLADHWWTHIFPEPAGILPFQQRRNTLVLHGIHMSIQIHFRLKSSFFRKIYRVFISILNFWYNSKKRRIIYMHFLHDKLK